MTERDRDRPQASRRRFLAATAGLAAAGSSLAANPARALEAAQDAEARTREPFWGAHQGGIVTPVQAHTYFAAFDLTTDKRDAVVHS